MEQANGKTLGFKVLDLRGCPTRAECVLASQFDTRLMEAAVRYMPREPSTISEQAELLRAGLLEERPCDDGEHSYLAMTPEARDAAAAFERVRRWRKGRFVEGYRPDVPPMDDVALLASDPPLRAYSTAATAVESGWVTDGRSAIRAGELARQLARTNVADDAWPLPASWFESLASAMLVDGEEATVVAGRDKKDGLPASLLLGTHDGKTAEISAAYHYGVMAVCPEAEAYMSTGGSPVIYIDPAAPTESRVIALVQPYAPDDNRDSDVYPAFVEEGRDEATDAV